MKLRFFIAFVALLAAFFTNARSAVDFFTSAPDAVIRLLPQATRLDMVDYFNYGSQRASDNYFDGPARVKALSSAVVDLQIDENVDMQIAVLPAKNDTIIAVVTTVWVPVGDSSIKFYTPDWKQVVKPPFIMPVYEDWLTAEGRSNIADVSLNLPFMPVSAVFLDDASKLVLTNNASQYLGDRQELPFNQWIIPSKTYSIRSSQFLPTTSNL